MPETLCPNCEQSVARARLPEPGTTLLYCTGRRVHTLS